MEYKITQGANDVSTIDGRKVTGFAAIIGNIDDGHDKIYNGAFRKTIKENGGRVKHFWQHDIMMPPVANILELKEVKREDMPERLTADHPEITGGLKVVREYLDTPRADEILTGIKAGALAEMSIGYDPVKFDYEEDKELGGMVRNLREIRLWDTSDVNFGMNSLTVSSSKLIQLESMVSSLLSPDALKEGRVLSKRNLERLRDALQTLNDVLLAAEPPADEDAGKILTPTDTIMQKLAKAELELQLILA